MTATPPVELESLEYHGPISHRFGKSKSTIYQNLTRIKPEELTRRTSLPIIWNALRATEAMSVREQYWTLGTAETEFLNHASTESLSYVYVLMMNHVVVIPNIMSE